MSKAREFAELVLNQYIDDIKKIEDRYANHVVAVKRTIEEIVGKAIYTLWSLEFITADDVNTLTEKIQKIVKERVERAIENNRSLEDEIFWIFFHLNQKAAELYREDGIKKKTKENRIYHSTLSYRTYLDEQARKFDRWRRKFVESKVHPLAEQVFKDFIYELDEEGEYKLADAARTLFPEDIAYSVSRNPHNFTENLSRELYALADNAEKLVVQ